ncbi:MAG: hypothetical protein ACO1SX_22460 [Actinomycetota bacterium]
MITRKPFESILYPPLAPGPALTGAVAWIAILYLVPLLPLLYLIVLQPLHWLTLPLRLFAVSPVDLAVASAGAALLTAAEWVGRVVLPRLPREDPEKLSVSQVMVEASDSTAVQGWNRVLVILCPAVVTTLAAFRLAGVLEVLLIGAIVYGIGRGSRKLARFPAAEEEACLPYSDDRIQELFNGAESAEVTTVRFQWRFQEHPQIPDAPAREYSFEIPFRKAHHEEAVARPHEVRRIEDYAAFVLDGWTCDEVVMVAAKLKEINAAAGYSTFRQVGNVLAFSYQFDYAYDIDTKGVREYPRYPVEMLWDRVGDCECHAILAAALLVLLGFETVLLDVDFEEGPGHIAVGVAGADGMPDDLKYYTLDGRRYFYCEATPARPAADGRRHWHWKIGDVPFEGVSKITPIRIHRPIAAD